MLASRASPGGRLDTQRWHSYSLTGPKLAVVAARRLLGTAGWSVPRAGAAAVPGEGTHLQRYGCVFDNTASGAALENALALRAALGLSGQRR